MKKILDFIEHLECPSVNGIIFPDEQIQLFDIEVSWGYPNNYSMIMSAKTSINALKQKDNLWWSSCAVLAKSVNLERSIEVVAGEGSYGSDGFVATLDLKSKKLIWLAFFLCSNPFDQIEIIGDEIHVRSTIGCTWMFKFQNPIDFSVMCF